MSEDQPDIIAEVRFRAREEGGREGPTPADRLGCIFEIEGENFDCFLLLRRTGPLLPGYEGSVAIKFLYPDYAKPRLRVGSRFLLKDFRVIAEGQVQELIG